LIPIKYLKVEITNQFNTFELDMVYLETFVLQNVAGTYKYIIILLITISYLV